MEKNLTEKNNYSDAIESAQAEIASKGLARLGKYALEGLWKFGPHSAKELASELKMSESMRTKLSTCLNIFKKYGLVSRRELNLDGRQRKFKLVDAEILELYRRRVA